MSQEKKATSGVEWRINVGDGSSKILVPETSFPRKLCLFLKESISGFLFRIWSFLLKAWNLGVDDPRKVVHGVKVGIAITVVSLFYYLRPLNDGVGGNAIWAVITVVVVFENNVGATICKCLNRVFATCIAGLLALGVHWVAKMSGHRFEPVITGVSVFILAFAATFSRFIPTVKARFDYGALIFILTFSFVSVSGYRVEELFDLAHQRLATIIIGTSFCILITMFICPIWAGQELHSLILRNMDKLANSLDGSMDLYFGLSEEETDPDRKLGAKSLGYKCVLSSKAAEESFANFGRWEPAHGKFSFKHPWKQYLKIGAALRSCAYCTEALNGCINSETQSPDSVKKHLSEACKIVSSSSSNITRELAKAIQTMRKSSTVDILVKEMGIAVQGLQSSLKSLPESCREKKGSESKDSAALMDMIPLATFASMLIEITGRVESVVREVKELEEMCEFDSNGGEVETMKILQRV
ncbi:Aluminum-activated malate transporter 10 [Linum perenne]